MLVACVSFLTLSNMTELTIFFFRFCNDLEVKEQLLEVES